MDRGLIEIDLRFVRIENVVLLEKKSKRIHDIKQQTSLFHHGLTTMRLIRTQYIRILN